jgi:uncharacterized protein YegL
VRNARGIGGVGMDGMYTKTRTGGRMPGGGISRRPLHVIILADCSGSMTGEKIQALNFAIAQMLQHLSAWEEEQERAQILVRAIAFATEPRWHIHEPIPVVGMRWSPLAVVPQGRTNMGPAFQMAASVLGTDKMPRRAFSPALLLITDGLPSDGQADFDAGLGAIMSRRAGHDALRMAVAIGKDARSEALKRFIADPKVPVLVAGQADQITDQLRLVTLAVTGAWSFAADQDERSLAVDDPDRPV